MNCSENPNNLLKMITSHSSTFASRVRPILLTSAVLAVIGFCNVIQAASVRFVPLSPEVASRKIGIQDSKGITELKDLNAKKRSKAYTCEIGETPLTLVALDRQRPNDKPSSVEVTVTPDMKAPLVLIFPNEDDPSGMRAIVVEDSSTGFPWGTLRFVNTTDKPLMIRNEKGTAPIAESMAVADIAIEGDARNMGIQLFSESEPDEILYSAVWEHDPNLRKLIFIVAAEDTAIKELTLEIIPQDKRSSE